MSVVTTFLWFENQAEEAANLYTSVIPNSRITDLARHPDGSAFVVSLELDGHTVTLMNGGPGHPLSDAVSLQLNVDTQEEVDRLWDALTANGGTPGPCGWLTDPFGLAWQVNPTALPGLMMSGDPGKTAAVSAALRTMTKLDIKTLQDAFDGV